MNGGDGGPLTGPASGNDCPPNPQDPNEKQGLAGYGAAAFVGIQQPWLYTVYFANETNATGYARQVSITDPLDPGLDIRTFRVNEIAFGGVDIMVPANQSFYQTQVPAPAPNPTNTVIDVSVGVNVESNFVFCTLNAIDLNTGELVASAFQGVLPPDTAPPNGEGRLVYSIKPLAGTATGTIITNQASIVFDINDPLTTDTTTNTVDGLPPTSVIGTPASPSLDTNILMIWIGTDDTGGSGVQGYDIYVSDDGGPWQLWMADVATNSATYIGRPGHTYGFDSLAHDNAGNIELGPLSPKAFVYISDNQPPVLAPFSDQIVNVGQNLVLTAIASNAGGGTKGLQFGAANAPPGLNVDPVTGAITFAPSAALVGTTNLVTIGVTNSGIPPLSATESFLIIVKENPVITWANPAPIAVGTELSDTQLDASANVLGSFVYHPPRGTVLPVGNAQPLSTTFTPNNTTDYTTATATVPINVDPLPTPGVLILPTTENTAVSLPAVKLALVGKSGSGGPLSITAVGSLSAQGGTVALAGGLITYTPLHNFVGSDSFTYTLFDGLSSAQGADPVTVSATTPPAQNTLSIVQEGNSVFLEFLGIPGFVYVVQSAPGAAGPWTDLSGSLKAGPTGLITYTATPAQSPEFYRTRLGP